MPTIECGIGVINYDKPENLKLEGLMDTFKDILEIESPKGVQSVIDYLDEFNNRERKDDTDLQDRVDELEKENDELREEVDELEEVTDTDNEIDCGIGIIEYNVPGNLLLADVMENLNEAIRSSTPKEVNELLMKFIKQPA